MSESLIWFNFFEGPKMEQQQGPPQGMAKRQYRVPIGGCLYETAMVDWLDEQLHASRCCFFPHLLPQYTLGRGVQVVSGIPSQ